MATPARRLSLSFGPALCVALALASALAPVLAVAPVAAQQRRAYPAAAHGGNYMHNFYLPPAAASTPWYQIGRAHV